MFQLHNIDLNIPLVTSYLVYFNFNNEINIKILFKSKGKYNRYFKILDINGDDGKLLTGFIEFFKFRIQF